MIRRDEMKKKDAFSVSMPVAYENVEKEAPPRISGFGIHIGLFNEVVEVPEDELNNIERTLRTAQVRLNHEDSPLKIIGRVNDAYRTFDPMAGKEGVKYFAELDSDDSEAMLLYGKIQKGYVSASSIGFRHDSICSICGDDFHKCEHWFRDGAHVIAKNCEVFELSIVAEGADEDATVASGLTKDKFITGFKKQFEEKFSDLEDSSKNNKNDEELEGGNKMVENPKDDTSIEKNLISELNKTKEAVQSKEQEIAQLTSDLSKLKEQMDNAEDVGKLKEEAEDRDKQIAALQLAVKKAEVAPIVDRKIATGLAKEEDKEKELDKLAKADEDSMKDLLSTLDILEEKQMKKEDKKEGKVPVIDQFKKEDGTYDDENPDFMQTMVHTIFHYERVFVQDGRQGIEGRSYMGL
jgi:hypothetical protein